MLLAVDARNREITIGLRDGSSWKAVRRIGAMAERAADEYAHLMALVVAEASGKGCEPFRGPAGVVDAAWISSVVPALTRKLSQAIEIAFGVKASVVGAWRTDRRANQDGQPLRGRLGFGLRGSRRARGRRGRLRGRGLRHGAHGLGDRLVGRLPRRGDRAGPGVGGQCASRRRRAACPR